MNGFDGEKLRGIAVRVISGKGSGSGCIVRSAEPGLFYCLTVEHCVGDALALQDGCQGKLTYDETGVICDKDRDVAVIKVDYRGEYPEDIMIGRLNAAYHKELRIAGFPSSRADEKNDGFAVVKAELNGLQTGRFVVDAPDVYPGQQRTIDQVKGLSGGGCFALDEGDCKLLGIECQSPTGDMQMKELECIDISVYQDFLRENGWPLLPPPRYCYASKSWAGARSVARDIADMLDPENKWVVTKASAAVGEAVRDCLTGDLPLLPVCGASGIGKTRTIKNVCAQDDELSNALFFKSFERLEQAWEDGLEKYVFNCEEPVYIIVDDIKLQNLRGLNAVCKSNRNVRIVAIAELGNEQRSARQDLLFMERCDEEDARKIIRTQFSTIPPEIVERICERSNRDLRFARLLAKQYERDPEWRYWSPEHLDTMDFSASEIIERIFFHITETGGAQKEEMCEAVRILSLFVDIAYHGGKDREIRFLGEFFEHGKHCVEMVRRCVDHELGVDRDGYFELQPRALAIMLFAAHYRRLLSDPVDFMNKLPTEELRRSFYDRVQESGEEVIKEVKGALAPWFRDTFACAGLGELTHWSTKIAMMHIEFDPEAGLPWLRHLIFGASEKELLAFSGYRHGRREVVWTCERLACFRDYFAPCEDILFRLSLYESERGIGNNSRGVWSGFFSVMLSDTELPFDERFELLLRRMKECREEWDTEGFESAMECVLSRSGVKIASPRKVGGRITPEAWIPKDLRELIDIHRRILLRLGDEFDLLLPKLREIVFAKLLSHMYFYYARPELREAYFKTVGAMAAALGSNIELMVQVASERDRLRILAEGEEDDARRGAYGEQMAFLEVWEKKLADESLEARLRVHLSRNSFSSTKEERRQEREQLAAELLRREDREGLLTTLLGDSKLKEYELGYFIESLGLLDEEERLKPYALGLLAQGRNLFAEEYFYGLCKREGGVPDALRAELGRYLDSAPVSVLRITISYDVTEAGFAQLCGILKRGVSDNALLWLADARWAALLTPERALAVLDRIGSLPAGERWYYFLALAKDFVARIEGDGFARAVLDRIAGIPVEWARRYVYEFIRSMEAMPGSCLQTCVELTAGLVDFSAAEYQNSEQIAFIVRELGHVERQPVVSLLCDRLYEEARRFPWGTSYKALVSGFPAEALLEWAGGDEERASAVAFHLPPPGLEDVYMPPITQAFMEAHGQNTEVLERFLRGIHSYEVVTYDEAERKSAEIFRILEEYDATYQKEWVRRWTEYERARLRADIEMKKDLDARDRRFRRS